MDRILKRYDNAPYGYLGQTVQMGKTKALAALGDITEERIARIRNFAGITGNIFANEDEVAEALAARSTRVTMSTDLRAYCDEQVAAATTEHEIRAAKALRAALAQTIRSRSDIRA
jgi:acyl homoserine lactone synthase